MQDDALDEEPVLDVQGLVEAEVVPDLRDQLGGRLAAGPQCGRVGGREDREDDEGQRADDDEQECAPEDAAQT